VKAMNEPHDIIEATECDALPLEYHRDCGTARGYAEVSDFVNNPFLNSPGSIHGLLSAKEIGDLLIIEIRVRSNKAPNPFLVSKDAIQSVPQLLFL